VGAPSETPEDVVKAYLAGTLQTGGNLCGHKPPILANIRQQFHCPARSFSW
jgi:hypothetical protein